MRALASIGLGLALGLVSGVPAAGQQASDLTLAEFLSTIDADSPITFEVLDEQEVRFSREDLGWGALLFLDEQLPPPGERSVAVTIEIVEDGGGWPDRAVGAGLVYAFENGNAPFLAAIVSPADGGVVQLLENVVDGGVSVGQSLGNSQTEVGEPVRLSLVESDGGLTISFGQSSISLDNAITQGERTDPGRIGFIVYGAGAYRISDLTIPAP
jgi:hypothetical protein